MKAAENRPAIVWFRRDLRLQDNPALHAACQTGRPVICLYVMDHGHGGIRPLGGAAKWWLDKSLRALASDMEARGGALVLRRGAPQEAVTRIVQETGARSVFWNRRYEPVARAHDTALKAALIENGTEVQTFNGSLLSEPWSVKTGSGGPYKVFSAYWRAVRKVYVPPAPLDAPNRLDNLGIESERLEDWALHPSQPDWSAGLQAAWQPGEREAHRKLDAFLAGPIDHYGEHRNRPDLETGTSRLSPHLRWGEIGPAQIWRKTGAKQAQNARHSGAADIFLSEIGWREFSFVLLFHQKDLAGDNYNKLFDQMPWRQNSDDDLQRWHRGQTGYPIVDAGMRELWQTGWMHNRARMITASFLTKHLLIDWRAGERWFWDTLVDADPAANAASWQWVAGSGADAAPYFRIFNPITQGEKFDKTGDYVRKWCPELARLQRKFLYAPWEAPDHAQKDAGIKLGETYDRPIVNHRAGRERALAAYELVKKSRDGS